VADILEGASAWLDAQRLKFMSRVVGYHRGEDSVQVRATIGKSVFEVDSGFAVLERIESRDYLVPAADLVLDDETTLPLKGDRIKETDGEKVFVYEVMAPGSEPHFIFSDPYRKTLRIHTKFIGMENPT
jgi:hypothetical protein